MSEIDLWRIYGSRQDTDAVIIRELDRDRAEAEANASDARATIDRIHGALHAVGLSMNPGTRFVNDLTVKIADRAYEDGPTLTREMVEAMRPPEEESS